MTIATRIGNLIYRTNFAIRSWLARLRTRRQDVGDVPIAYYEGGPRDADTILMLHGYTADRTLWVPFAAHCTKRYHVVIPDMAGHGDTPFVPGAGYSAPAQARRLAGLLDALGIDRVHIIGNSMGGFIAATFARLFPQRTLSVGLSDAVGVQAPVPCDLDRMLEAGHNPFLLKDAAEFDDFFAMTMAKPPFAPRIVTNAQAHRYVHYAPRHAGIFDDYANHDMLDDALDEITAPTLVSWGDQDRIVAPSAAQVWADGLPNAEPIVYEDIGHMPMMEIPRQTAKDHLAFLAALPPR